MNKNERPTKTKRWAAVGVAVCAVLVLLPVPVVRTAPVPILEPVPNVAGQAIGNRRATASTRRSRLVSVDLYPLPTPGTTARTYEDDLELALFPDVTVRAVFDHFETVNGSGTWLGHLDGGSLTSVSLAYRDGRLYGHINTADAIYEIRPAAVDGPSGDARPLHIVSELDPTRLPEGGDTVAGWLDGDTPDDAGTAADSADLIDLMVVYTPGAVTYAGGNTGIANLIATGVADTNAAYANSRITQRLRLVHTAFVPYAGTSAGTTDLTNLRTGAGAFSGVPALRDQYGADLVMLVYSHPTDVCGVAYLSTNGVASNASAGYSIVEASCIANYTFAHELGHNMGALHDWFVGGSDAAVAWPLPFARGHVNAAQRWRTVMSYNDLCSTQGFNCSRINYFSNPDVEWIPFCSGTSFDCDLLRRWLYPRAFVGAASGSGTACRAGVVPATSCETDNRRTLNTTAQFVANYRQRRF